MNYTSLKVTQRKQYSIGNSNREDFMEGVVSLLCLRKHFEKYWSNLLNNTRDMCICEKDDKNGQASLSYSGH